MNFAVSIAFDVSQTFWYVRFLCSLVSSNFWYPLWFFVCYTIHLVASCSSAWVCFWRFFFVNFIVRINDTWYAFKFLNLWKLVLWPQIQSVLENVLCFDQKNVYSVALNELSWWISIMKTCCIVSITSIFCCFFLVVFSIEESKVLNSGITIVLASTSLCRYSNICCVKLPAQHSVHTPLLWL